MPLCPPCKDAHDRWLDYTPPAYQNRYIQTWKEAAGGYLADRSMEIQDMNRRGRDELVRFQLDLIRRICQTKHQGEPPCSRNSQATN